jgi:hypothetical protein
MTMAETLTQQLLDAIGKGISLARDGGAQVSPGQVVHVQVVSPDLSQLSVPVITSGDVSVTWLAKSVRFGDALPAPLEETKTFAQSVADYLGSTANVIGGMPIPAVQVPVQGPPLKGAIPPAVDVGVAITTVGGTLPGVSVPGLPPPVPASPAALPGIPPLAPSTITQDDVLSGVPGLLGQIAGAIPVLVNAPVSLSVTWSVQRNGVDLVEGTDFLAPGGLTSPAITLIFGPTFKELGQEGTSTLTIVAKVTLHAFTESVDVPPLSLTVTIPDLGLPRVLAAFRHSNFSPKDGGDGGFAFVMVPGSYPFREFNQLSPVLTDLQTALSSLQMFVHVAGFLIGLNDLLSAVPSQPDIQFRAADKIGDLEDIVFESHILGDYDADEEISSAILIGLGGTSVEIFNDDDLQDDDGKVTLTTGDQMWAALTSFSFHDQGEANNFAQPDPSVVTVSKHIGDDYNDEAESIQFA